VFSGESMFKIFLSATTALALVAGSAFAQQTLRPGGSVTGELNKADEQLNSGEFVDTYEIEGRAGDRVSLSLRSDAFDPYLLVRGPGDFSEENDDAAEGDKNASLDLSLPASGVYRVMATSYEAGETGRYTLAVGGSGDGRGSGGSQSIQTSTGSQGGTRGGALQPGGSVSNSLRQGDETLSSGEFVDTWRFPARRGQTYTARLESGDFDSYLLVRGPGELSEDNDDDAGQRGSRNSRVTFTAAADGEISVSATSFSAGETGGYRLALEEGDANSASTASEVHDSGDSPAITVGETRDGRLGQGARQLTSGEYVNTFTLRGRRGQQLDLGLSSQDFDPFVQINGPDDFTAFNDDAEGGGHDSRLVVTLPTDGVYTIAATSYAAAESGRYRLTVRDGEGYEAPRPEFARTDGGQQTGGRIDIGDAVSGVLQSGDSTLTTGEYVDTYTFQGERGSRLAVELTSSAFDAYTMLTTPSGEQIENDDGEDGTNSRLDTVLTESGEYRVSVTSFSPGETGSYRFSVAPSQGTTRQAAVQGGARVFAVMVGVSDYGDENANLAYTDQDALKLAESLRREGVLNPSSVTLTNAEATVAGVRGAFQRVAAQAGPDDMFLFFFSGHGGQTDGDAAGVSASEPDGRTESIVLRDGEITDVEMAGMFGSLHTRLSLLVLDSCFSGGFARNVVDRPGVMGLFSSEEDLTSAVANKFEAGGYLAHFLRTGLSGEADGDGDQMVTAGELATYLRREFVTEAQGVEARTAEGQRNYQNLVIDRGGVQIDDVVLRLASNGRTAAGSL